MPGKGGALKEGPSKAAVDHRAKQLNPNNELYYSNRGVDPTAGKAARDNHAKPLNPNNAAHAKNR